MKRGFNNRRCPRCGGNLYLDSNYYVEGGVMGWDEQEVCLQCGYINYEANSTLAAIASNEIALHKEPLLV
jgi:predicted nucleic-acid-binding Zn-ribbon protein